MSKICNCEQSEKIERYLKQFGFCPDCGGFCPSCDVVPEIDQERELAETDLEFELAETDLDDEYEDDFGDDYQEEPTEEDYKSATRVGNSLRPHHWKWKIIPMYAVNSPEKAKLYNTVIATGSVMFVGAILLVVNSLV